MRLFFPREYLPLCLSVHDVSFMTNDFGCSVARKNPRKLPQKLEFMKYDPRVRKHVLFRETKLR